jgi:hypothetical protein
MKAFNTLVIGLFLAMLAASSCATLNTSAAEQEEIISEIQKEQVSNPVPLPRGNWVDANGWEYEGLDSGGGPD